MIKDSKLSDILNNRLYKDSDDMSSESLSADVSSDEVDQANDSSKTSLKDRAIELMADLMSVFILGYAVNLITSSDWRFYQILAIGYTIEYLMDKILVIFSAYKN